MFNNKYNGHLKFKIFRRTDFRFFPDQEELNKNPGKMIVFSFPSTKPRAIIMIWAVSGINVHMITEILSQYDK